MRIRWVLLLIIAMMIVPAAAQSQTPVNIRAVGDTAVTSPLPVSSTVANPCTAATCTETVVQPTGTNLHAVIDSGTTTVTQTTGTNLHAVLDSGTTTVTQATGTNLHVVADSGTITTVGAVTAITNALPAGTNVLGHVIADTGSTTAVTALPATPAGTNTIGKVLPAACSQTTPAAFITVGVANGGGTSITSTTSCIVGSAYVNNTSNSAVTLRLQDKTGTPVVWVGGNADFSIPANSNLRIDLTGLVFTSGITAIAGTNAVLNLFIPTLQ